MLRGLLTHRRLVLLAVAAVVAAAFAIPAASGKAPSYSVLRHTPPALQRSSRDVVSPAALATRHRFIVRRFIARPPAATCEGGTIDPGTYSRLTIDGECLVNAGPVMVQHNVTVTSNGALLAVFGDNSSKLVVGGNLNVQPDGAALLGCDPSAFQCFDDSYATSKPVVFGGMNAQGAFALIIHDTSISHDLTVNGGGGGYTCNYAYDTFEDVSVGGDATVANVTTCWLGFIRNAIGHNVSFHDNVTYDPDGNEVVSNSVKNNLDCYNDSPAPQFGDSQGNLDLVLGMATNQCSGLAWPGQP